MGSRLFPRGGQWGTKVWNNEGRVGDINHMRKAPKFPNFGSDEYLIVVNGLKLVRICKTYTSLTR